MPPVYHSCAVARRQQQLWQTQHRTRARWRHQAFGLFRLYPLFCFVLCWFVNDRWGYPISLFKKQKKQKLLAGCVSMLRLTSFFFFFLSFLLLVVVFFYDFSSSLAHIEHDLILEAEIWQLLLPPSAVTHRP